MAEGDGAQNQGQKGQSDLSKEVKPEVVDQKKLDRAAKERERRRRRRRKKAELKRLERETLEQQGALPGPKVVQPVKPEAPQSPEVLPKPDIRPPSKAEGKEEPKKQPGPRRKKVLAQPDVLPSPVQQPKPERHIAQRSEEHAPRSKVIIPQAESKEENLPTMVVQPEEAAKPEEPVGEPHPLSHKTHSFAGPLIEPSPQAFEPEASQPAVPPEPQQPPVPESEPQPRPEVAPVSEPQPGAVPRHEPEPQPQPPQPEVHPEPEDEHRELNLEELPPIFPPDEESDLVIHDRHEEVRPKVNMEEIRPEQVIPYPQPSEEQKPIVESQDAEEVKPVKKIRKPEEKEHKVEKQESAKETMSESEGLNERKSLLQAAGGFSAGVLKAAGTALHNFRLKFDLKKLGGFLLLMLIGGGLYAGYLLKVHEKVYNYAAEFFKAPPPVEVTVDEQLLREWGITTALLFGDNRGSTKDLLASQISNAYYFGYLSEPRIEGETGITPAYFYGKGEDLVAETNRFIGYVKNLRELVSVYDVDVYKMLDQTTEREKAMSSHVAKLKEVQEKSNTMLQEINTEIDDLKVSLESLNPEKASSESDFFAALQGLAGEKADFLLKSFIDISQKQTAIKAHLAALEKLAGYYDTSLQKLAIRITAIEKNYQVLVQGIRVVDIPGANLDIIIKQSP